MELCPMAATEGRPVRYLCSTFTPGESHCRCLFEVPYADLVREVNVNNHGQVAGLSETNATVNAATQQPTIHPFLWQDGHMLDLGTLGGTSGYPNDMNDRGEVVGVMNLAGDQTHHAFLWDGTKLIDLQTLGGGNSEGEAINPAGDVVGRADPKGSVLHAVFLWKNGVMTDLGKLPGQPCSTALAVNSSDQVVGETGTCDQGGGPGFLWQHGTLYSLQTLVGPTPLHVGDAYDINDRGEIAATASLADGNEHAVLLVPKP